MINLLKRFVNLLAIFGTLIGVALLLLPDYNYKIECIAGMVIGYMFVASLNYLFFGKPVIINTLGVK